MNCLQNRISNKYTMNKGNDQMQLMSSIRNKKITI